MCVCVDHLIIIGQVDKYMYIYIYIILLELTSAQFVWHVCQLFSTGLLATVAYTFHAVSSLPSEYMLSAASEGMAGVSVGLLL